MYRAVAGADDLTRDGQTQAAALARVSACAVGAVESVEELAQGFFRHALSVVGEAQADGFSRFFDVDVKRGGNVLAAVLDAVFEEVFKAVS